VELAELAVGMHDGPDVTLNFPVNFTIAASALTVNVAAAVNSGGLYLDSDFTYEWNWGFSTDVVPGVATTNHTYGNGGAKTIVLTVKLTSTLQTVGTYARSITLVNPDLAPVVDGTCTWDANTWAMDLLDSSSDDGPDGDNLPPDGNASLQIVVDWGDGSTKTIGAQGATLNHVYARIGDFLVTQRATDSKLQTATRTCGVHATPGYFTIGGTVKNLAGTVGLGGAKVQVKRGTTLVKTLTTSTSPAALGTFTTGATLKPGTYTLTVTKAGWRFTPTTVVVGPDQSTLTINGAVALLGAPMLTNAGSVTMPAAVVGPSQGGATTGASAR
jgi:hypothetical protein